MKLLNRLGLYTKDDVIRMCAEAAFIVAEIEIEEKAKKRKKTKKSKIDVSKKRQVRSPHGSK